MRLVAVSVVKNEADIIEAFVRHTLAWVDRHLVFDHDSTDGTREILQALQAEGLPLTLFRDDAPGHLQQHRSNYLTRLAAHRHDADWILPLDADEILVGPNRAALEQALLLSVCSSAASLPLLDYCSSPADDQSILNPALRLQHCRPQPSPTRKIFIPRALALEPDMVTGKGSHALYRGDVPLRDHSLPASFHLAHLALRSPEHQVLRIVRAELQRLSRGQAGAGLDVHYRLAYQLLADNPGRFFSNLAAPTHELRKLSIDYRGGPLRLTSEQNWIRVARALLPWLEQLATSHGRLADAVGFDIAPPAGSGAPIEEIHPSPRTKSGPGGFFGFTALDGWGHREGPVPEACLPCFHWGYAPLTRLTVNSPKDGAARIEAEVFTYSENQEIVIEVNGVPFARHTFVGSYQLERLSLAPSLRVGENEIIFRYARHLQTSYDPRKLAVIFLSLGVTTDAS
ncbi:MAG: hypothetical protein RLZZ129_1024 [Verrucomicrobiota bacterium]|jgi:hypothetical protein